MVPSVYNGRLALRDAFAESRDYGRSTTFVMFLPSLRRRAAGATGLVGMRGRLHELQNLGSTEGMVGLLGGGVDAIHNFFGGGNVAALEPVMHVGLAAHGPDVDDLLESEDVRGDAGVNGVGEFDIV